MYRYIVYILFDMYMKTGVAYHTSIQEYINEEKIRYIN